MDHRRGDQQDRCQQGAEEGREVESALEVADGAESLVQRRDQQEGEQHLNARQRDAQLAHALVEIAVVPLEFGFAATP
jgi:hypothetical protein